MRGIRKYYTFAPTLNNETIGFLAQLVEQWIENPCVPGSIPGETTNRLIKGGFFMSLHNGFTVYNCNRSEHKMEVMASF